MPQLFEARPARTSRCAPGSPGCSTGEEAYSIAMLLREAAARAGTARAIQVFATDIDERAIAAGRAGVYPEAIVTDVPPARLRRTSPPSRSGYRINKTVARDA